MKATWVLLPLGLLVFFGFLFSSPLVIGPLPILGFKVSINQFIHGFFKRSPPPSTEKPEIIPRDTAATKKSAKEQFCIPHIRAYESLYYNNITTIAKLDQIRDQLRDLSAAPLPPFPDSIATVCPPPAQEHCMSIERRCGRRDPFKGLRCTNVKHLNSSCIQDQHQAEQSCHNRYHRDVQKHIQDAEIQKEQQIQILQIRIKDSQQEHARISNLITKLRNQYDFCKNPIDEGISRREIKLKW